MPPKRKRNSNDNGGEKKKNSTRKRNSNSNLVSHSESDSDLEDNWEISNEDINQLRKFIKQCDGSNFEESGLSILKQFSLQGGPNEFITLYKRKYFEEEHITMQIVHFLSTKQVNVLLPGKSVERDLGTE